jgi:hypothetical protein
MTYGLVFCGNSYHGNTVFKLQKEIIRIMVGIRDRVLQKIKNITTTVSVYISTLIVFTNRQHFKINYDIHNTRINIRNNLDLHYPVSFVSLPEGFTLYWD